MTKWLSLPKWIQILTVITLFNAALIPVGGIIGWYIGYKVEMGIKNGLAPVTKKLESQAHFDIQVRSAFEAYHPDASRFFTRGGGIAAYGPGLNLAPAHTYELTEMIKSQ